MIKSNRPKKDVTQTTKETGAPGDLKKAGYHTVPPYLTPRLYNSDPEVFF
jgi:hypothetical protein